MSDDMQFVTCRCGKEYPVLRHGEDDQEWRLLLKVRRYFGCKACEADTAKDMDMCVQVLHIDGGVSGCRLGWHHMGRCEPWDVPSIDQLATHMGEAATIVLTGNNDPDECPAGGSHTWQWMVSELDTGGSPAGLYCVECAAPAPKVEVEP